MKNMYVGTSGFSYKSWIGKFYPKDLPQSAHLEFYADHFNSVEINNSFYHLPLKKTYKSWFERTGPEFRFAIKGSRYITQILSLNDTLEAVEKFFDRAESLEDKLAVVLWQLPANLKADTVKLCNFIEVLQKNKYANSIRHAFEFRHQTWFTDEIYRILEKNNHALVIQHSNRWPIVEEVTADFIYLRFHGAPQLYASNYSHKLLSEWAKKAKAWSRGRDLFAYFNNDARGHALSNANSFTKFLQ